jgi:hypothetical protein
MTTVQLTERQYKNLARLERQSRANEGGKDGKKSEAKRNRRAKERARKKATPKAPRKPWLDARTLRAALEGMLDCYERACCGLPDGEFKAYVEECFRIGGDRPAEARAILNRTESEKPAAVDPTITPPWL